MQDQAWTSWPWTTRRGKTIELGRQESESTVSDGSQARFCMSVNDCGLATGDTGGILRHPWSRCHELTRHLRPPPGVSFRLLQGGGRIEAGISCFRRRGTTPPVSEHRHRSPRQTAIGPQSAQWSPEGYTNSSAGSPAARERSRTPAAATSRRVRSCRGLARISTGGASSTTAPSQRTRSRSAV